jgi:tripartite-type tricarboxylate transporter receptor subunit TctC
VLNGAFYSLQYDLLNDFAPIAALVKTPLMIVGRKTLPARDLTELIVWLKANPNKASVAVVTSGIRFLATYLREQTGTQFALVPYRGGAPALQDLLAGQIDMDFDAARTSVPLMRSGGIRAYAVTGDTRLSVAPDIPTFSEMGLPALSYIDWTGFFAPKGTPAEIIGKLNIAAVEALADPAVSARVLEFGSEIFPRDQQTPGGLGTLVRADAAKWWPIIKKLGIRAE